MVYVATLPLVPLVVIGVLGPLYLAAKYAQKGLGWVPNVSPGVRHRVHVAVLALAWVHLLVAGG